jgi:hypothetical protein
MVRQFTRFADFYEFYLSEHGNRTCRRLHFIGTTCVIGVIGFALAARNPLCLLLLPVVGYSLAWVGHLFFEHNHPATFKHPFYSLMADFVMYKDMLTGRIKI